MKETEIQLAPFPVTRTTKRLLLDPLCDGLTWASWAVGLKLSKFARPLLLACGAYVWENRCKKINFIGKKTQTYDGDVCNLSGEAL